MVLHIEFWLELPCGGMGKARERDQGEEGWREDLGRGGKCRAPGLWAEMGPGRRKPGREDAYSRELYVESFQVKAPPTWTPVSS